MAAELNDADREWAIETLKTCGCGDPELVFALARDVLAIIDRRWRATKGLGLFNPEHRAALEAACREEREALNALLGKDSPFYWLTLYWLDACDLIEHGSIVSGSWLTDSGKVALARLQTMLGDNREMLEDDEEE